MSGGVPIDRRSVLAAGAAGALVSGVQAVVPDGPWTERGDLAVGGGSIRYARLRSGVGSGEPLVLLPKLGGWIADWRHVAPLLARTRTVIAIDPPGHGDSVMAGPVPHIMTIEQSVAMIMAALDQLGIDRCSIAGQSAGGVAGIVAAGLWPGRVRRLILTAVSLTPPMSREVIAAQDRQSGVGAPGSYYPNGLPAPENPTQTALFATMDHRITAEHDASRARAGRWVRACERGVGRLGAIDYLPRVAAPTLLLYADRGRYVKYVAVAETSLPRHESRTIVGSGSFAAQEQPAQWAAAAAAFLDQPDPA